MNFLAHAYLSFTIPDIVVGNMISDFVKGKKKYDYPPGIQNGIVLHRSIDEYTDRHPVTQEAKQAFRSSYGLYAGAFVDVAYDFFLANDTVVFPCAKDLESFSRYTYSILNAYSAFLPEGFKKILPHMEHQDWLSNYRTEYGIQQSFGGLVRRAQYLTDSVPAFLAFKENYALLQNCYTAFFPQLKSFATCQLSLFEPT